MIDTTGIMMIEPRCPAAKEPLVDEATRKMTAAWRSARHSDYGYRSLAPVMRGMHFCTCGVTSDNHDHWVGAPEMKTNDLAIHYLAFHRPDVPLEELAKVMGLNYGEETPTEVELKYPRRGW